MQPSTRVLKHDDVATLDTRNLRDELIYKDSIVDLQRLLHRNGGNIEAAHEERLQQERDEKCHHQDDEQIAQERQDAVEALRPSSTHHYSCSGSHPRDRTNRDYSRRLSPAHPRA